MPRLISVVSGSVVTVDEAMAAALGGQWVPMEDSVEKLPAKVRRALGIPTRGRKPAEVEEPEEPEDGSEVGEHDSGDSGE